MLAGLLALAIPSSATTAQISSAEYAARRTALLASIDSGVVIAFGAAAVIVDWPNFFQLPAFQYLTGFAEPDAVLVMVRRTGTISHDSEPNTFQVGDVFAVEPGLYFSPELLANLPDTPRNPAMLATIGPAFERYKGIGIKIEDNYALTESGLEWLSKDVPREIGEIESLMRERSGELPGGGRCGA
jgi:hypothetical protein